MTGAIYNLQPNPEVSVRFRPPRMVPKEPPVPVPGATSGFRLRGKGTGRSRRPSATSLASRLTERDIRAVASDDVALWLDAGIGWQDALPHILRELGVNISAWHDACDAMGEPVAFLALPGDRPQTGSTRRRRSSTPGGALRAFTRKARLGELDLTRSLLGIWERERQGRQPKGAQPPGRPS